MFGLADTRNPSGGTGAVQIKMLKYKPENIIYKVSKTELEKYIKSYASSRGAKRSSSTIKEVERIIWQFAEFIRTGTLRTGTNHGRIKVKIEPPVGDVEYLITPRKLEQYVEEVLAAYSSVAASKRLKIVKRVLKDLGMPEHNLKILDWASATANKAGKREQELKTPFLTIEDAREFFRRLERLHDYEAITIHQYIKAIAFMVVGFTTGLRVSEIARLRLEHIEFENHRIVLPTYLTKEGRLLNTRGGSKVVFLSREAEAVLKFYIENYRNEIEYRQEGYLFVSNAPTIKAGETKTTLFIHKIMQKSRKYEAVGANLDFQLKESPDIKFSVSYMRKLFIQVWGKRTQELGLDGYMADMVVRKLTGHSPPADVHKLHYQKITLSEMWEYYKRLYYNLSFLTERQKGLFGLRRGRTSQRYSPNPGLGSGAMYSPHYVQRSVVPVNLVNSISAWN